MPRRWNDEASVKQLLHEGYDMLTSEVLYKAADLIEQRGWTYNTEGWHGLQDSTPLCAEGAICAAMGATFALDDSDAHQAVRVYTGDPKVWNWNDSTYWRLHNALCSSGLSWDDAHVKAIELGSREVVEALRAAAIIAGAQSQPVRVYEVAR